MWRLRRWWEAGLDRGKEKEFSAQDKKEPAWKTLFAGSL